jgi:hypothetical protein
MCKTCGLVVHAGLKVRGLHPLCTRDQKTNIATAVQKYQVVRGLYNFYTRVFHKAYGNFQSVILRLYPLCTSLIIKNTMYIKGI